MAWSKVLRFDDPFVYSSAVQAATPTILPTARGSSFEGMLTQVRFDRLWMQRFEVNLPLVSTGALPGNRKFFAFTYGLPSGKVRHSGVDMGGEGIATLRDTFHLRSESSLRLATMSLPVDSFSAACETLVDREFQDTGDFIRSSPQSMLHLSRLHDAIGRLAHDIPDILQTSEVARAIEDQTTFALVRCLTVGVPDRGPRHYHKHRAIMRRFEEFLAINCSRPVYLGEVCMALGVAERTLRACCEDYLGMGPIRYLVLRRMHLVRQALLRANNPSTTVTRIVTDHGFWELGRFSVAYRALFGEKPSETLRRCF